MVGLPSHSRYPLHPETALTLKMLIDWFPDREVDLDIPEHETLLKNYCATLGHKACHSFEAKNAKFEQIFHPR